ncbi:MAG TPA: hypothetical protein VGG52_06605 [Chthoniobacterales bacterium]|jgi:hypothetical protein
MCRFPLASEGSASEVNVEVQVVMITGTDVTVWTISGLLAIGIGWSAYAKRKTRDKLVRELAAMEPDRREKVLQRLNPKLAMEMREQLMERFQIMS